MADNKSKISPKDARTLFREQKYTQQTCGFCDGFVQANVVILPKSAAPHFKKFCEDNPKPAPLLEILPPGQPYTRTIANNADIRTDLPKYRIYEGKDAKWREVLDIKNEWKEDLVTFFLGCSFSFESALQEAGIISFTLLILVIRLDIIPTKKTKEFQCDILI
ncbi:hypothetical protein RFI_12785 [Reticulomyxa filosa]|uniref:Uncharacterized protein n=1 Tax=Reticulomyxa filosa TaxID=46433 RepID=X6NF79_RETFI|nr:hypothetical protein RFI_12785 [Reticulomyxa filosa]|eukprot:ETO24374.1 hypothetical protein RFI_12785 [Reticulomyxa filosa]